MFILTTTTLVMIQGSKGDSVDFGDEGMQVLANRGIANKGFGIMLDVWQDFQISKID